MRTTMLAVVLFFAACAPPLAHLELDAKNRLQFLIHTPIDRVVETWGPPLSVTNGSAGRLYSWQRVRLRNPDDKHCPLAMVTLTVDNNGFIDRWSARVFVDEYLCD